MTAGLRTRTSINGLPNAALLIPLLIGASLLRPAAALPQTVAAADYRHLYTFGSRYGIHPPKILNRRSATAFLGKDEHPYGLAFPVGVATDSRHRVWITDSGTASIHVFDHETGAYREFRKAGDVILQQPSGIAADQQGRMYMTDSATGDVFVFDENGEFDRSLIPRRAGRLLEGPTVLAISENSRTIYVADPPRRVILALNREGEEIGSIPLPAEVSEPLSLTVIGDELYVLGKAQSRIAIFHPNGRPAGDLHWDDIRYPAAFAFDPRSRRYFVANPQFMVVDVRGEDGVSIGGFGSLGDGVDQVRRVDALHVDAQGLVYVVDSHHGKVLVFSAEALNTR